MMTKEVDTICKITLRLSVYPFPLVNKFWFLHLYYFWRSIWHITLYKRATSTSRFPIKLIPSWGKTFLKTKITTTTIPCNLLNKQSKSWLQDMFSSGWLWGVGTIASVSNLHTTTSVAQQNFGRGLEVFVFVCVCVWGAFQPIEQTKQILTPGYA